MAEHSYLAHGMGLGAAIAALLTNVAGCSSETHDPEDPPSTARVAEWTPTDASPRYGLEPGEGGAPRILDGQGALLVDLGLRFVGQYGEAEGEAGCATAGTCLEDTTETLGGWRWTEDKGTVQVEGSAETSRARVTAVWTARQGDPRVTLHAEIEHLVDAYPDYEALGLALSERPALLGGDLRFAHVTAGKPQRSGPWTPHRVVAGTGDRAHQLRVEGIDTLTVNTQQGGGVVTLVVDTAASHPFRPRSCTTGAVLAMDRLRRAKGDVETVDAELALGHTWSPLVSNFPDGAESAVAIADLAIEPSAQRLAALLWGASNDGDPRYGNGGFLGHNLGLTVGVPSGPSGFGAREIVQVVHRAAGTSVRFADASPSAHDDGKDFVDAGLRAMGNAGSTTWFDPDRRSCEGILAEGWRSGGTAESLAHAGFRTVVTTEPLGAGVVPIFAHNRMGQDLTLVHATVWGAGDLMTRFTARRLSKMAAGRRLAVVASQLQLPGKSAVLESDDQAGVITTGRLEGLLFDLADAVEKGALWVPSVDELAARLEVVRRISLTALPGGDVQVTNRGETTVSGLTLHLLGGEYGVLVDGKPPRGTKRVAHEGSPVETLVWFDLPAKTSATLTVNNHDGARISPLVAVQWTFELGSTPDLTHR